MRRLEDLSPLDWFEQETRPHRDDYTVGLLIPSGFDAYCRLFHPVYENLAAPKSGTTWTASPEAQQHARTEIADAIGSDELAGELLEGASFVVAGGAESGGALVRWTEIASRHGFVWHDGVGLRAMQMHNRWPITYFAPDEGDLPLDHVHRLIEILDDDRECFLAYQDNTGYGLQVDDDWVPVLYRGRPSEIPEFVQANEHVPVPTYWWPDDRSWFVALDADLPFTVIGGPEQLIERLVSDDLLQCARTSINFAYLKDTVNADQPEKRRGLRDVFFRR